LHFLDIGLFSLRNPGYWKKTTGCRQGKGDSKIVIMGFGGFARKFFLSSYLDLAAPGTEGEKVSY